MQLLELGTNRVLIDFTDSPKLYDFSPKFVDAGGQSYRRGDARLVSNDSKTFKAELTFEFQRLTQAEVDALAVIYREREHFICVPDPVDAPSKRYTVRWASGFDLQDTIKTDWTQGKSLTAVFLEVGSGADIFTPTVAIEIQGVDVTDRRVPRSGMTVGKSLDYPELLTFRSAGVAFDLDNADGAFDYNNPSNFFIAQGLPAHGRGAQVLVKLGRSRSEMLPVFAGEISEVVTSLQNTIAKIKARDLSVRSRQKAIENFGIEITRRITDFEDVAIDYDALNPVFYFPIWGLPISRNSVSLVVHSGDTDININIVEAIKTEGVLSNRNAEIDYQRGLIRFEAPPDDGADTQLTATWKRDYRYKRPDFLIRQLLKTTGIQNTVGIAHDTQARFAIEQALVRHPSDKVFSSHGRPFFEREGIVRWVKRDGADWWMAQDSRLVKYDEAQDEYEEVAQVPGDDTITEAPPGGYGTEIEGERITLYSSLGRQTLIGGGTLGVFVTSDAIYHVYFSNSRVNKFGLDGVLIETFKIRESGNLRAATLYDNYIYFIRQAARTVQRYNLSTQSIDTSWDMGYPSALSVGIAIAVTPDRIYLSAQQARGVGRERFIRVFDHSGTEMTSENFEVGSGSDRIISMAPTNSHIYMVINNGNTIQHRIDVYTYGGTKVPQLSISPPDYADVRDNGFWYLAQYLTVRGSKLYIAPGGRTGSDNGVHVFALQSAISYENFTILRFDTTDFENFFCLCTNTSRADITRDASFNHNRIMRYVRSTGTWTKLGDNANAQPQIAEPFDGLHEIIELGDNKKAFYAVSRNSRTLIFYRRVQSSRAGVSFINVGDGSITDVYGESRSGNDGLPYSIDFVLDQKSDGIYVYTFVVKYSFSGTNFRSATLKVYRKRVEPSGPQTEIFSETFTGTSGTDYYPVSVSSIILADDRSKFYFTLEFFSESDTAAGKAELCTIAKSGSGARTVLKTYDNPLVGPRSPVQAGSDYYYLEGGWFRLPSNDEEVPDKFYYPDEGGTLIEIESNGDITDHGIVWRSGQKADSPDPDPENPQYNGYGRHNAIVSNTEVDSRGNLRFVAGYGLPYRINNNLLTASITSAIPDESNFNLIQFGQDLATKIASFPTNGRRGWDLIQQLAELMLWEIGFGPGKSKVDAVQARDSNISDWSANASLFFRPRTILPAKLRTPIGASGRAATIEINDSGLPAEMAEFPVPPSGERYAVIVDKELFSYTGVTPDSRGRALTGVARAQHGSTAAAHSVDAGVYFADYFASGEQGTTLVSIQSRSLDFVNLRNNINVGFGDRNYPAKNQRSIDEHEERTFNLGTSQTLLSRQDRVWAELIGDRYLKELSSLKEVIPMVLVFSPELQPGQLVVVYQLDRVRIEFKLFRLLQVQHNTRRWQTGVTALEIIP